MPVKSLARRLCSSRPTLLALIAVGAVYVITLALLPEKGLWVVDNADKYLQMKAIEASNYSDYSIPWPGQAIDPTFKYRPIPDPFSYVEHGKMYAFYPPFFATVSSFCFRAFGFRGLAILPLLASLAMLGGIAALARGLRRDGPSPHVAVLVAGLCTPIWFYSVVFWEHTAAVCLSVWAIFFYLRFAGSNSGKDLVVGSVLAVLAVYFRDELYLLCAVLVICASYWQKPRRLRSAAIACAAMVLALVPLWLFQWKAIGHPLGHHLGSMLASESGIGAHLRTRPIAFYNLFVASTSRHWLSFVASGPFLVLLLLNPRFSRARHDLVVPVFALVAVGCSIVALAGYFTSASPIDYLVESCNSFLTVAPVLILAFVRLRIPDDPSERSAQALGVRRIWTIAVAYSAAYAVLAPELGTAGMHWGNRFLLGIYPLFGLLAAINVVDWGRGAGRRGWQWGIVALVVILSLAAQVYSLSLLHKKMDFSQRLNEEIHKRPEKVMITQVEWAPLDMYSEFNDKVIFLASTKEGFDQLVQTLGARGYDSALLVAQLPEAQAKGAILSVDDNGLDFFTLRFFALQIGAR